MSSESAALVGRFVNPRTIAVVGASEGTEYGGKLVRNLLNGGFPKERLCPVNPKLETVQGIKAYKDIRDVPIPVDLAVVVVRSDIVPDVLRGCAEKGIAAANIISAGFGEQGPEGLARQNALVTLARELGIRLVGPNSLGITNVNDGIFATSASLVWEGGPPIIPGGISLISQSGALAYTPLARRAAERGIGYRAVASVGNQADLTVSDFVEYFAAHDPQTSVIAVYLEGLPVGDGRRFLDAVRTARAHGKPVLVLKVGRTAVGEQAARSHTAAFTGSDRVYNGCFEQAGAVRVEDLDDLWEVGDLFRLILAFEPRGGIGMMSNSGGFNSVFVDQCGIREVPIASASQETADKLDEILKGFGHAGNPADITNHIGRDSLVPLLHSLSADPEVDLMVVGITPVGRGERALKIAGGIQQALNSQPTSAKPYVVLWPAAGSAESEEYAGPLRLHREGIPVFREAAKCARALQMFRGYHVQRSQPGEAPDRPNRPAPIQGTEALPEVFDPMAALQALSAAEIPIARSLQAADASAALRAAEELGYPITLKLDALGLGHKSEVGAVRSGISLARELAVACEQMWERTGAVPDRRGFIVQEQASGHEIIVGGVQDPVFGPVVMVGSGGIWAEVHRDVVFRPAPVDAATARGMLERLASAPLLRGARGQGPYDVDAAAEAIVRFSELFAGLAPFVTQFELNPLFVLPEGGGVRAVDAYYVGGGSAPCKPRG